MQVPIVGAPNARELLPVVGVEKQPKSQACPSVGRKVIRDCCAERVDRHFFSIGRSGRFCPEPLEIRIH